jgi:DnaJ-class molecular chaperone
MGADDKRWRDYWFAQSPRGHLVDDGIIEICPACKGTGAASGDDAVFAAPPLFYCPKCRGVGGKVKPEATAAVGRK